MEYFFTPAITWETFGSVAMVLLGTFLLIKLLQRKLHDGLYLRGADRIVRKLVRVSILALDPIFLLAAIGLFVAVWPAVHGLIALLVVGFAFRPIREYVSGRVVRFDRATAIGHHLIAERTRGVINGFGLTGLYLQQEEGRTRIPYTTLLREGYTVATDPEVSAYYHLLITLQETEDREEREGVPADRAEARARRKAASDDLDAMIRRLRNRLVESPYVRRGFTIAPHAGGEMGETLDLDVGLHRGDHVRHLIRQLREAGFEASLVDKQAPAAASGLAVPQSPATATKVDLHTTPSTPAPDKAPTSKPAAAAKPEAAPNS